MLNGCELFLLLFGFGFIYTLIKWLFPPQLRACDLLFLSSLIYVIKVWILIGSETQMN
jgi:hypothetical protein